MLSVLRAFYQVLIKHYGKMYIPDWGELLTAIYFRPVDVIEKPIANKERINGASLKAAGRLLPGHSLITVSLAFALIGENRGSEVE